MIHRSPASQRRTRSARPGWSSLALVCLAVSPSLRSDERVGPVVEIKPDRIMLMDLEQAGERLFAVGERGFVLLSDDDGRNWTAVPTPVTRTLTGLAFKDARIGIAVGHGASVVRTHACRLCQPSPSGAARG